MSGVTKVDSGCMRFAKWGNPKVELFFALGALAALGAVLGLQFTGRLHLSKIKFIYINSGLGATVTLLFVKRLILPCCASQPKEEAPRRAPTVVTPNTPPPGRTEPPPGRTEPPPRRVEAPPQPMAAPTIPKKDQGLKTFLKTLLPKDTVIPEAIETGPADCYTWNEKLFIFSVDDKGLFSCTFAKEADGYLVIKETGKKGEFVILVAPLQLKALLLDEGEPTKLFLVRGKKSYDPDTGKPTPKNFYPMLQERIQNIFGTPSK